MHSDFKRNIGKSMRFLQQEDKKLYKAVQSITNRVFRINFMNIETCDAVVSKKKCKEII